MTTKTITSATVSGLGPAFLVPLTAATNVPGLVVAETASTGAWQVVPHGPEPGYPNSSGVAFARNARFTGGTVVTGDNTCVPDCASGHTTTVRWTYDAAKEMFLATPGATPGASAGAAPAQSGG